MEFSLNDNPRISQRRKGRRLDNVVTDYQYANFVSEKWLYIPSVSEF